MQTLTQTIEQEVPAATTNESTLAPEERQLCEVWTRVMGYHRPVSSFNRGKQGEFHERKSFCEPTLA
jgi:hypothetical protein